MRRKTASQPRYWIEALDQQQKAQQFAREEVFMGFTYAGDPFACIDRSDVIADLRQDMSYFKSLAAELRDSKFQTIVISGNGAAKHSIPEPRLDAARIGAGEAGHRGV